MKNHIEQYIQWKATYTKRAAINYRPWIEKFNRVVNKPIEKVNIEDIVKFRKYLDDNYQSYSIQFGMVVVQNFFKFWKLQDVKCINPILIRVPKIAAKSYQALNEDEYYKLLKVTPCNEFHSLRDNLVMRLLWETGVRVSELCDLNVSDIDPKNPSAVIRTKKTDRKRQIFWTEETHQQLLRYLGIRREMNDATALFVGKHYSQITPRLTSRTIQRIIQSACKRAKLEKKISPHSFRHGKAHQILHKQGTVKDVQMVLGHSEKNPAASFVYLQFNNLEMEKRARAFL